VKQCSALVTCLALLAWLGVSEAHAESKCSGARPWVAVSSHLPAGFAEAVRSDLRAGLAPSNIEVCEASNNAGTAPVARVALEQIGPDGARYSLDVTDSVTQKRVGRDLSLDQLPADGRAFALAVAAEELLRATWAELSLRGVPGQGTAAPPEVRAIVEKSRPPPARPQRHVALGARLAFEHFLGGQTHYGADLFGALPFAHVAAGFLAIGARRALSSPAPHGSIGASALSAELGLSLSFLQRGGLELGAFVSARLLRLSFEPEATSGAAASAEHGLAMTSRVGLNLAFGKLGVLRSYSALGAGLPLKSFSAADTQVTITGASELELFASAGLALELP
jgi:hypothetical protein